MRKHKSRRFSTVTAVAAIVGAVALTGGTAVAVGQITSADIRDQGVRSADIRNGAVGTRDLNDDGIRSRDIRDGNVRKRDLTGWLQDRLGAVSGYEADGFYDQLEVSGEVQKFYAECEPGKVAVGGGFSPEDGFPHENLQVVASRPSTRDGDFTVIDGDPEGSVVTTAWEVWAVNLGSVPVNIRMWSTCVDLAG